MLRNNGFGAEQIAAILRHPADAGLEPAEVAMMAFAEKISLAAHSTTAADLEELRSHGLSDAEMLDIVLATSARNFFSKVLDALGAEPDPAYEALEPEIRTAVREIIARDAAG